MPLNQVEIVQARIMRGIRDEIVRIRMFVSMTEGNAAAIEQLRGDRGDALLASLTGIFLDHLGHVPDLRARRGSTGSPRAGERLRTAAKGKVGA